MPELRDLPAIETLMQSEAIAALVQDRGATVIKKRLREMQAQMRETRNVPQWATAAEGYAAALDTSCQQERLRAGIQSHRNRDPHQSRARAAQRGAGGPLNR